MNHFTFSWGKNYIAVRGLLRVLGQDLVAPPAINTAMATKGIETAHPFLCFSGKLVLGQLRAQLEQGNRSMVFMSSLGPEACRCADTSEYLEGAFGEDFDGFSAHRIGGGSFGGALANLRSNFGPRIRKHDCFRAYAMFYGKVDLLFKIEKQCTALRCLSSEPQAVQALEEVALERVDRTNTMVGLWRVSRWFDRAAERLPRRSAPPSLRIGIVGGEHILSELDSVMARIKRLAEKGIYIDWRSGFRLLAGSTPERLAPLKERCRDYLHDEPSTSEIFSCAHALEFAEEGYDGVLHVYAFGCMPQSALKPVLQRVAQDAGIPLLSLSIGDRFAEEGLENRLEAFVDLLTEKRASKRRIHTVHTAKGAA